MQKLSLLFTKDGLQYQILKNKTVTEEHAFFADENDATTFIAEHLQRILQKSTYTQISVISALNHFTLMPEGFSEHSLGYDLIALNAPISREEEELMLSVDKKYGVQFYYALPNTFYHAIKALDTPVNFNFSGAKFLSSIQAKNQKEIHINLYHNQCEFIALDRKKVILYNNLDMNSEVDFLYFIMFTLSKIEFGIAETTFMVYGETTQNETFISELRKFVKNLKIVFDNVPRKNFIMAGT